MGSPFEEASQAFLDPLYFSVYERIEDGEEPGRPSALLKGCC
jgi:hypothetical protein